MAFVYRKIKVVATDIDGTLTVDRERYDILPEAVMKIQKLRDVGVKTVLVTANALPVALGLGRYIGASGIVAENGCIISIIEEKKMPIIQELCEWPNNISIEAIASALRPYAISSWQNPYRKCDFAFIPSKKEDVQYALEAATRFLIERGFNEFLKADFSGYAIHLHPSTCNKLLGLKSLLFHMGYQLEETLAIGDSKMDTDIVKNAGLGIAVANSDDELKNVAQYVTKRPSGYGFVEAIDKFIFFTRSD